MALVYKLNKSELTRLKQEQKVYQQFLPVLQLKQEQLQIEQIRIKKNFLLINDIYQKRFDYILSNAAVFTDVDNPYCINEICCPEKITIVNTSVAGVFIPTLKGISFKKTYVNYLESPYWLSCIINELIIFVNQFIELKVINKQYDLIDKELKKTTQKINLFEKVLIPETNKAIKKISIILGDEQISAVGRAKIAKNKKPQEL